MATKAYLMIDIKEQLYQDGRVEGVIADLETIPEIKCVQLIDGTCDLLAEIGAPIRVVFVANKVRVKEWVKHLRVLKVDPFSTGIYEKDAMRHILWARGSHPQLAGTKPVSPAKEAEETHVHKEPLGSPTPYLFIFPYVSAASYHLYSGVNLFRC